jgi:hypothetical protein
MSEKESLEYILSILNNYYNFENLLIILIAICLVLFFLLFIWYISKENVKKLNHICIKEKKTDKCSYPKKCMKIEAALGKDINEIMIKCLK